MVDESIFTEYEMLVQFTCGKYLDEYKQSSNGEFSFENAEKFMNAKYDNYRKDIASISTELIHKSNVGSETSFKIINQNSLSIGKLFAEIMKLNPIIPEGTIQ